MADPKPIRPIYVIFGIVIAAVAGYFVWSYLAPPPFIPPAPRMIPTDVQTDVLNTPAYLELRTFAASTAPSVKPGRPNPFEPIATNQNANANTNAPR